MSEVPVEILLAVYRPDPRFFEAQLRSLDAQDYPALTVRIIDDSVDERWHAQIRQTVGHLLTRLPYTLTRNDQNLGAVGTFARLTKEADAPLLAYCDQDDLWLPGKVSALAALLAKEPRAQLAYCNLSIIDARGREQYATLQDYRKRFRHQSGDGLSSYFLQQNCVTGACMMVRSALAQSALPFPSSYVHDQWLALAASLQGPILYDPTPWVQYRLHGNNVIGMASLSGVRDRESYVQKRLRPYERMLSDARRFHEARLDAEILRQGKALSSRIGFLSGHRLASFLPFLRQGILDPVRFCFELSLGLMPRSLGCRVISFAQRH